MKYIVSFDNGRFEREIGVATSRDLAFAVITNFLNEHHYKSYYWRCWEEGRRLKIDVGSWSEFFYIKEVNEK